METFCSNKILTVSELTFEIKSLLEKRFTFITLKGEISNFKSQSSGHMYFSLKDDASQISCVLFKKDAESLKSIPKDGDQIIVEAQLSVYPPRGNYQLIIRKLSYLGLGELLQKLHELKETLKKRGWFDPSNKKSLPLYPKKIGIVTSPTGSVIQDILNVLKRRFSGFHLILNPVKVQGIGSKEEIASAIEDFNKYNLVDVIIVARGGGSLEDLWAFNEEIVAKAIFESTIPIISAIGHETDFCISDFVADIRAPTPSAAAEIVIKEKNHFFDTLSSYKKQISKQVLFRLQNLKIKLNGYLKHPIFSSPYSLIGKQIQMLDDIKNLIENSLRQKVERQRDILKLYSNQVNSLNPLIKLNVLKNRLNSYQKHPLFSSPYLLINKRSEMLDDIRALIENSLKQKVNNQKDFLKFFSNQLNSLNPIPKIKTLKNESKIFYKKLDLAVKNILSIKKERFTKLVSHLNAMDPKNVLKKGYSILFSEKDSSIILSESNVSDGDKISALLSDGKIYATIERKK
ncbi:MAG: exodeoxyribonuclease VII large subunit [Parachlamydiales bacterium]